MKKYFAVIFVGVDCSEAMKTLTFNTIELPKLTHKKPLFLRNVNIVTYSPQISPQFILPATIPKEILIIYSSPIILQISSQLINYNIDPLIVEYVCKSFLKVILEVVVLG